MIIDDFLNGCVAIHVTYDTPFNDLLSFQLAIEDHAGMELGHNRHNDGFADYCRRIIAHVIHENQVYEIEVCYDDDNKFGYMQAGTDWFQEHGYAVVEFDDCFDAIKSLEHHTEVSIDDLESVLN